MKRMLFNATHAEEFRVALVDGQQLVDLDLESATRAEKKGNIYKGVVTKVEPGLEAAFVDYGGKRQGFLPLKEIYRGYFAQYDAGDSLAEIKIADEIREGQEMVVQVTRDELGAKGAALTTFISLAGRFLVLMPNNPKGGGISRRVASEDRGGLRQTLADLKVDTKHAIIARTAGIGRSQAELQWDLDFLQKLWETIEAAADVLKAPRLIHQESNLIIRSIRDHLGADVEEVVIDDADIYARARRFMEQVMPHNLDKLKHYTDTVPLFSKYQIEQQIASAFDREVRLPSGGAIVIDYGEALIAVDVNSARATKGADIEETALQTNLEAVHELARQLRIRDLGGLVVIDLIDMTISRNQRAVETHLRDSLRRDRARVQVGKISRFGLLEMSRQRLRASIGDANYQTCPRCEGTGVIRNVVSSTLNLLRLIEARALQENTEGLQVILPLDMATYLLNEKRREIHQIETRLGARIMIIPSTQLASPHFQLKRLGVKELDAVGGIPSYQQQAAMNRRAPAYPVGKQAPAEQPYVQRDSIAHQAPPAPRSRVKPKSPAGGNWLRRLWQKLTGAGQSSPRKPAAARRPRGRPPQPRRPQTRRPASAPRAAASRSSARAGESYRRSKFGSRVPAGRVSTSRKPAAHSAVGTAAADDLATDNSAAGNSAGRGAPAGELPERPTRRDFAAHDPRQRVGPKKSAADPAAAEAPPAPATPVRDTAKTPVRDTNTSPVSAPPVRDTDTAPARNMPESPAAAATEAPARKTSWGA